MNDKFLKKFLAVERLLSSEKGAFKLFALIQLEELPGRWDVVMSGEKLPEKDMTTLRFVVDKIHGVLTQAEIIQISRIILLNLEQPFVKEIEQFLTRNQNPKELFDCEIDGLKIKHAHIIISPVINEDSKVLISATTLNDLTNRINQLENIVKNSA